MAQHGPDSLGRTQALHGHLSERLQRLLCEYTALLIVDVDLTDISSPEMAPAVITKGTTGSAAVSTTW